ncbi:MAG: phage head morphogenesis protein [Methanoregula sp.]|nr:phage head morphogenesis protein [Methanoregula sp.]
MTDSLLPTDISSIKRAVNNYLIADDIRTTDIKLQQLERATAVRVAAILKRQGEITLEQMERLSHNFEEEARQDLQTAFSIAAITTRSEFARALSGPMAIASALGGQTLTTQLGIKLAFNPVDPKVHAYLEQRAAERIGGIDETTRARLNTVIEKGYKDGKTYQQIARDIRTDFEQYSIPGGGERAKLIAVTEIGEAHEATKENMIRQIQRVGFKMKKFWLTMKDEKTCPICSKNMADGWIPIDQPHSSGHMRAKAHPKCRCPELYRADLPDTAGPQGDFAVSVSAIESFRPEIIEIKPPAPIESTITTIPEIITEVKVLELSAVRYSFRRGKPGSVAEEVVNCGRPGRVVADVLDGGKP